MSIKRRNDWEHLPPRRNENDWDNFGEKLPVYVISLDRDTKRWKEFQSDVVERIPNTVHRVAAVDAKAFAFDKSKQASTVCNWICSETMVAIFQSHRKVWKRMVEEKVPAALICEDDARFVSGFNV